MLLLMLVEFELALLDLSFGINGPIVGFLLSVEMIADSGVAFDADNCSPVTGPVLVLSFGY